MKHYYQTTRQPQRIFATLVLTSLLSLGTGIGLLDVATASVGQPSQPTEGLNRRSEDVTTSKQSRAKQLPPAVLNAVREDLAHRTGTSRGPWRVVSSSPETWPNTCLGLAQPDEFCGEMLVEGWRVVMSDGRQTWIYRTDSRGDTLRIEPENAGNPSADLPRSIADAVLQAASQRTGLSMSQLRIVKAQQIVTNGCLGLVQPDEACFEIAQMGWEVTVESGRQRLVYRTDAKGSLVRLNEDASNIGDAPSSVIDAVLRAGSQRTGVPTSRLTIVNYKQIRGSSSCLELPRPGEGCTRDLVPIWQVTVGAGEQRLIYHASSDGSQVRLNEAASNISDGNLPDSSTKIPASELPSPLGQREVFRAITSGGIAGMTYQTTLMNNGQVIRVQLGRNNNTPSKPEIHRISRRQLRQFQQLLERQTFSQFNQLAFPAPTGAADYFTVTLTSKTGTTRYADIAQNQLPESLQAVIQAWNRIASQ